MPAKSDALLAANGRETSNRESMSPMESLNRAYQYTHALIEDLRILGFDDGPFKPSGESIHTIRTTLHQSTRGRESTAIELEPVPPSVDPSSRPPEPPPSLDVPGSTPIPWPSSTQKSSRSAQRPSGSPSAHRLQYLDALATLLDCNDSQVAVTCTSSIRTGDKVPHAEGHTDTLVLDVVACGPRTPSTHVNNAVAQSPRLTVQPVSSEPPLKTIAEHRGIVPFDEHTQIITRYSNTICALNSDGEANMALRRQVAEDYTVYSMAAHAHKVVQRIRSNLETTSLLAALCNVPISSIIPKPEAQLASSAQWGTVPAKVPPDHEQTTSNSALASQRRSPSQKYDREFLYHFSRGHPALALLQTAGIPTTHLQRAASSWFSPKTHHVDGPSTTEPNTTEWFARGPPRLRIEFHILLVFLLTHKKGYLGRLAKLTDQLSTVKDAAPSDELRDENEARPKKRRKIQNVNVRQQKPKKHTRALAYTKLTRLGYLLRDLIATSAFQTHMQSIAPVLQQHLLESQMGLFHHHAAVASDEMHHLVLLNGNGALPTVTLSSPVEPRHAQPTHSRLVETYTNWMRSLVDHLDAIDKIYQCATSLSNQLSISKSHTHAEQDGINYIQSNNRQSPNANERTPTDPTKKDAQKIDAGRVTPLMIINMTVISLPPTSPTASTQCANTDKQQQQQQKPCSSSSPQHCIRHAANGTSPTTTPTEPPIPVWGVKRKRDYRAPNVPSRSHDIAERRAKLPDLDSPDVLRQPWWTTLHAAINAEAAHSILNPLPLFVPVPPLLTQGTAGSRYDEEMHLANDVDDNDEEDETSVVAPDAYLADPFLYDWDDIILPFISTKMNSSLVSHSHIPNRSPLAQTYCPESALASLLTLHTSSSSTTTHPKVLVHPDSEATGHQHPEMMMMMITSIGRSTKIPCTPCSTFLFPALASALCDKSPPESSKSTSASILAPTTVADASTLDTKTDHESWHHPVSIRAATNTSALTALVEQQKPPALQSPSRSSCCALPPWLPLPIAQYAVHAAQRALVRLVNEEITRNLPETDDFGSDSSGLESDTAMDTDSSDDDPSGRQEVA